MPCEIVGEITLGHIGSDGTLKDPETHRNTVLYGGYDFFALAISSDLRINAAYLEYKNLADPSSDPLPSPSNDKEDTYEYFLGLETTPDVDFVRLPLLAQASRSSTLAEHYAGNKANFLLQSSGEEGYWGKPFTSAAGSTVYGAALVCSRSWADITQDIVVARWYGYRKPKIDQIGGTWSLHFADPADEV